MAVYFARLRRSSINNPRLARDLLAVIEAGSMAGDPEFLAFFKSNMKFELDKKFQSNALR